MKGKIELAKDLIYNNKLAGINEQNKHLGIQFFNELSFSNLPQGRPWKIFTEDNLFGAFKFCHALFAKPDEAFSAEI